MWKLSSQTMAVSKFSGLKDPDAWAAEKGTGKALRMFKGSGMLRFVSSMQIVRGEESLTHSQ